MKTYLFLLLFVFQAFSLSSQISLKGYNQEKIDPSLFEGPECIWGLSFS